MTIKENISVYFNDNDKKIIIRACNEVGLNQSAFCRNASIIKAREIIKQNLGDKNAGANTIQQ